MSSRNRQKRWLGSALLVVLGLTQCTAPPKKNYGRKIPRSVQKQLGSLAPTNLQDSLATPSHAMSKKDYPFDASGNYREDWVRSGGASTSRRRGLSSSSSQNAGKRYHTVRSGETLYRLSREYDVTLHDLRKYNSLPDYSIRTGQILRIPSS